MNISTNFEDFARKMEIDPVEAAVMDVARAVQITQTMHKSAENHYQGLARHVDRPGSPFEDMVDEVLPSGSFAIHAATRSRLKSDQHDVDAVLELNCPENSDPEWVLNTLYQAIKGPKGSKYHDYLVEKNSRCVTVTYPDGVTVDLIWADGMCDVVCATARSRRPASTCATSHGIPSDRDPRPASQLQRLAQSRCSSP